jgi:hypothetical protein
VLILVAWWIGKNPETTNLIVSVSDDQSNKLASGIADTIERNPRWKDVFPAVVPDKDKGWSRDGYYVKREDMDYGEWAKRIAGRIHPTLSFGGIGSSSIIGKRVTGICACDDLHDEKSLSSKTIREQTINFFKVTIISRLKDEARLCVVGNRWYAEDVIGFIKSLGLYDVFEHPATERGVFERFVSFWSGRETVTEDELEAEARTIEAEYGEKASYWGEVWGAKRLLTKFRELGELAFDLMFMCNDKAYQGRILKAEWLRPFPASEIKREWACYYGVDPAFKKIHVVETKSRKRSRFALHKWRVAPFGMVIEDVIAGHMTEAEAEALLVAHAAMDNPVTIMVESNGVGDPFYQSLVGRTRLPLIPKHTNLDTVARAQVMSRDFQFGKVRVSDADTEGLKLFRQEWLSSGVAGASDDTISAAFYAWESSRSHIWYPETTRAIERENAPQTVNPFTAIERAYYG